MAKMKCVREMCSRFAGVPGISEVTHEMQKGGFVRYTLKDMEGNPHHIRTATSMGKGGRRAIKNVIAEARKIGRVTGAIA